MDDCAKETGISGDDGARNRLAGRILCLFNEGVMAPADIRQRLTSSRAPV